MDREAARAEITKLVAEFENNRDYYDKTDEANIETKLIEPLFAALGWTKDDFEKREKVKRKDRRGITDYMFKLHEKSVFVLEAKKVKVDVDWDEGTWKQAISYTFSKQVSFSVLTNFKNLLIFCTEDEKAMRPFRQLKYTEYLTSRFEDLWLLSKDGFEQNLILERAASEGRMKKRRTIDKELLGDLLISRKKIVESIEQNYSGKYTTLEKDDIAQRILGRLIFMRKCENKQINFDKDGKEIEMLKEVTAHPHNEAYPKLKKIFAKYNDVFDSELFLKEEDSDVDKIEIDGRIIKELINSTYESKDGNYVYNFEWIDADVLGNIYEDYLGNILKETQKQTRLKESHAHRKEQGIYYTPTEIVKYIVDKTLGEILKGKKPEEIKKLRVLDPACGSGSFLIKAFDVIEEYYEKNGKGIQQKFDSSGDFYTMKEHVLTNNIFGVDLDRKAVEIAQLNLLLKIAEKKRRLPMLQQNIKLGNSLIDDEKVAGDKAFKWGQKFKQIMDGGGFDVVIGNPPYGAELSRQEFNYLKQKYVSAEYKIDTYGLFIERGLDLLKNGGYFGFIIPNTILTNNYFQKLREKILKECQIIALITFGYYVFQDAKIDSLIIILKKEPNREKRTSNKIMVANIEKPAKFLLSADLKPRICQSDFTRDKQNRFNIEKETHADIGSKLRNTNGVKLLGALVNINLGFRVKSNEKLIHSDKRKDDVPILHGRDIGRYNINFQNRYFTYNKEDIVGGCSSKEVYEADEKLLIQAIRNIKLKQRIVSAYDDSQFFAIGGLLSVTKKSIDTNLKLILALLNSRLLNFYFTLISTDKNIKVVFLNQLPVAQPSPLEENNINILVNRMLSLNKRLNEIGDKKTDERHRIEEEIKRTDAEIDEQVYKLYGITDEEKKIIEESLS